MPCKTSKAGSSALVLGEDISLTQRSSGMISAAVPPFDKEELQSQILRIGKEKRISDPSKLPEHVIAQNRAFWRNLFNDKSIKNVVAPMVDQSELAFRMFMRQHGADLTFTPMIHAHLFVNDTTYRKNILSLFSSDRPIIVQFCANNAETLRDACRLVEGVCDGVDLNLGCPQNVAKRGHYGSYLQDEVDLICSMISAVSSYCDLPISAKIRIKEDREETKDYARRIVEAGASLLTVHGRTREMKGVKTGLADWSGIREIVESVDVPVIANGNIQMAGDIGRCLAKTGAAAVMSAEGILYNPLLFKGIHAVSWRVAREYLHFAQAFQAETSAMRAHIFRICHYSLLKYEDLLQRISLVHSAEEFIRTVEELGKRCEEERSERALQEEAASQVFQKVARGDVELDYSIVWDTPHWLCKPYIRPAQGPSAQDQATPVEIEKQRKKNELRQRAQDAGMSIRHMRKKEKRASAALKTSHTKPVFASCRRCKQPAGLNCHLSSCKKCCRFTCRTQLIACPGHGYDFSQQAALASEAGHTQ